MNNNIEKKKEILKKYAPCAAMSVASTSAVFGSNAVEQKRTLALMDAQLAVQENSKHFSRRWRFKSFIWKVKKLPKRYLRSDPEKSGSLLFF